MKELKREIEQEQKRKREQDGSAYDSEVGVKGGEGAEMGDGAGTKTGVLMRARWE